MFPSGLPDVISDDEDLARFLTSSRQYSKNGARHVVFLPSQKTRETSVFRHSGNPPDELWSIFANDVKGPSLHGAAIVKARDVKVAELDVIASEPPHRHAAITGWPWIEDDPALQKAQQKERAMQIASSATLLLNVPSTESGPTNELRQPENPPSFLASFVRLLKRVVQKIAAQLRSNRLLPTPSSASCCSVIASPTPT